MAKKKEFKDSVHGYISIPEEYCIHFIDTPIFQRLRRIEQTSMRVLFPSAHHDRFVHSLGVFYLGTIAFRHLKRNSKNMWSEISDEKWDVYEKSFQIACLLHDCAHSPFSHTFEKYYITNRRKEIEARLFNLILSSDFQFDFKEQPNPPIPAVHEIISSIIILEEFTTTIEKLGASPELVVRMIMGCVYFNKITLEKRFINCCIRLLNGDAIDVDKLDYILRDTWTSGVNNVDIDVQRLLSSICIVKDNEGVPQLAFKKSALSVIDSVIIGRNFLFQWIYSHHKVIYEQYIIKMAVEKLSAILSQVWHNKDKDYLLKQFFSVDALLRKIGPGDGYFFYLPTDGDLYYLLKIYLDDIPEAKELITRKYRYKPLWKTPAEFRYHFKDITDDDKKNIEFRLKENLIEFLKEKSIMDEPIVENVKVKLVHIQKADIYIYFDPVLLRYNDSIFNTRYNSDIELNYFHVFVPGDAIAYKKEIIDLFRSLKA